MSATRYYALALVCAASIAFQSSAQDPNEKAERAIRAVTEQYYAALTSRNADLVMSFWNVQSPDFTSRRRAVDRLFAAGGPVETHNLFIGRISSGIWQIGTAIVHVSVDVKSTDPRTGAAAPGAGPWDKTLRLAYEGGSWNVWSELDSEDDVDALDVFQEQLAKAEANGDQAGITRALLAIGRSHRATGDYVRAMEYFERSLPGGGVPALNEIAGLFADQGDDAQAFAYYDRALKTLPLEGRADERAAVLTGMADIRQLRGEPAQALPLYEQALALAQAGGHKAQASVVLQGMGRHYFGTHDYQKALDAFTRALDLYEEVRVNQARLPELLLDITKVHFAENRENDALSFLARAHDAAARSDYLNNIWEIRQVLGEFRRDRGKSFTERARTDPGPALARSAATEFEKARNEFGIAIETIEAERLQVAGGEIQQQRFMEGRVRPYQEMVGLLVDSGTVAEAFSYAERSKGRVLLDVLQRGRIDLSGSMTEAEQQKQRNLESQLASLNTAIARERQQTRSDAQRLAQLQADRERTRLDREAFQTSLYAAHPAADVELRIAETVSVEGTAGLIENPATALLEYVITDERTYLFVLTRESAATPAAPSLAVYSIDIAKRALADRVEQYRQRIASRDAGFRPDGHALYDLLLGPAAQQLKGKTSLVVVPDGVLWDLPFQALLSPAEHFVTVDHAVSYAPSLTVLREFTAAHRPAVASTGITLLAFGNPTVTKQTARRLKPVFMDESLDPLPQAEKQVLALRALYGSGRSRVYVGAEAREGRVKEEAAGVRVLQFATHGILNSTNPMYSHLVLSQTPGRAGSADRNEDGLLEAWEIMNLKLDADIVVLAACETARGRVGAGEGMIGMAWAFFVAGAPTTVASQWKVESASTTELMLEFHQHLKARLENPSAPISKARAMQLAAQKLLASRDYQHPFYWAGFVVIGDGR